MDLTPGAMIAGRYRVERKVGSGGMGEVWAGEHRTVGSRVALKTLLSAAALNHEVVARFKREALILGRIRSDHVARVVDFVADKEFGLVLVMEFIEGDSLSRVLADRLLTIEETIELGVDVARALIDLHQAHIVHRDLKPGNIILQPMHGERRRRAVVVDFGVSRVSSGGSANDEEEITGITKADMAVGTIEYMAPEQILNSRNVTSASDIYAVGAILYRAVAGRHVFGNIIEDTELANLKLTTEPLALAFSPNDNLAKGLTTVVMRALKRRPSERYKSAEELLRDLLPLRDQARIAKVELDSTTIDRSSSSGALSADQDRTQAKPSPRGSRPSLPTEGSLPNASNPSVPGAGSFSDINQLPAAAPPGRGISMSVLLGAVLAALAGGAALGAGVLKPKLDAIVTPEFIPSPPVPLHPIEADAPSAPSAPVAPAAPAASAPSDTDASAMAALPHDAATVVASATAAGTQSAVAAPAVGARPLQAPPPAAPAAPPASVVPSARPAAAAPPAPGPQN